MSPLPFFGRGPDGVAAGEVLRMLIGLVSIRTPSPLVPRDPPRGRVNTDREGVTSVELFNELTNQDTSAVLVLTSGHSSQTADSLAGY